MKNKKNGFTLVELLAVIAVLGLILIIAVPKITGTLENSKKKTLELTAKSIARSAEERYIENEMYGIEEEITCDSISDYSKEDFNSCTIKFNEEGTASVTLIGKGSYKGLNICNGTKMNATATSESCPVPYGDGDTYITNLLAKEDELHNGLVQTTAEHNGTPYNAGIRYVGPLTGDNAVKNQVYFNCEPTDGTNAYGSENYDYASSCEIWRIIGVFNTKSNESDINGTPRVKIININSTFFASWDSSARGINNGWGINQWGPSGSYEGADLMQLLNGYYIGKPNSECKYNYDSGQSGFGQTCTTESLTTANMKPLTTVALSMATSAVWDTYAVKYPSSGYADSTYAEAAYLQEKGISAQYTGISECSSCSDGVERTTSWTGLVGLMSVSDIGYANGWLYNGTIYPWSISPLPSSSRALYVWFSDSSYADNGNASNSFGVWPAVYLDSNVQIIGGEGVDGNAYKLKLES